MITVGDLGLEEDKVLKSMVLAAKWLAEIAQVKTESLTVEKNPGRLLHKYWKGAIRGEYRVAEKTWSFFCPIWHTGQAVKALVLAYHVTGIEEFLESAILGAEFILHERVSDPNDPDYGLIFGYEDLGYAVNTSAILECLDGLIYLSKATSDKTYWDAVIDALEWLSKKAYINGTGIFRDVYNPSTRSFIKAPWYREGLEGRPLLDDGIFLKGFLKTSKEHFRKIFYETAEKLLQDEYPPGNWVKYPPSDVNHGILHPRMAYWWGRPMVMAYLDSKEKRFLDCAIRAGDWYTKAQRRDGGLFRHTYIDFSTECFGHETSGIACASILWLELMEVFGNERYLKPLEKAIKFCMRVQFTKPLDPNLKGCILSKVLPPDGSDKSPYHIRDLATIFYVQATAKLLEPKYRLEINMI